MHCTLSAFYSHNLVGITPTWNILYPDINLIQNVTFQLVPIFFWSKFITLYFKNMFLWSTIWKLHQKYRWHFYWHKSQYSAHINFNFYQESYGHKIIKQCNMCPVPRHILRLKQSLLKATWKDTVSYHQKAALSLVCHNSN